MVADCELVALREVVFRKQNTLKTFWNPILVGIQEFCVHYLVFSIIGNPLYNGECKIKN